MGCSCFSGLAPASKPEDSTSLKNATEDDSMVRTKSFTQRLSFLSEVDVLKTLPLSDYPAVAAALKTKTYKAGARVMTEGEIGNEFFVIRSGAANVLVNDTQVAKLLAGKSFGEVALLYDKPRNATVVAEGELVCDVLSRADFEALDLRKKVRFKKRKDIVLQELDNQSRKSGAMESKSPEVDAFIKSALRTSADLGESMRLLTEEELGTCVFLAYQQEYESGADIIKQGGLNASLFYILEEGSADVLVDGERVLQYDTRGQSFGGLAMLLQAPRAATVRSTSKVVVWCIPRSSIRAGLKFHVKHKVEGYAKVLAKVQIFQGLAETDLRALADSLMETSYEKGQFIAQEHEEASCLFILTSGKLASQRGGQIIAYSEAIAGQDLPHIGEETIVQKEDSKASRITVEVISEKANVLVLDRETFASVAGHKQPTGSSVGRKKYDFANLQTISVLGCGGFGKVTLVKDVTTGTHFALKSLSKGHVMQQHMETSVMNEKNILRMTYSPFLVRLAATFNHTENLIFLLEVAIGGELFTIFNKYDLFGDEQLALFYSACVVKAFDHLHERHIIYRDMKLENLLLDSTGYCKLTDFGLAKFVVGKTFTTCGSTGYIAPEALAGIGHGSAFDWWTLGILAYEFMMSVPPFGCDDNINRYYGRVRKGIDKAYFPKTGKSTWPSLVNGLCKNDPTQRLACRPGGSKNVMKHSWFVDNHFDWELLAARKMKPPWDPQVSGAMDTHNFDVDESEAPPQIPYRDPKTGWENGFEDPYGPISFDEMSALEATD